MKKVIIYLCIILISTVSACKSKLHLRPGSTMGVDEFTLVFDNYARVSDTLGDVYLKFPNGTNSKNIAVNNKGNIIYYSECGQLGGAIKGAAQMIFWKNRLRVLRFTDSNNNFAGPMFVYKKNGKLKHIFIYKNSRYFSTYYTTSPRSIKYDTTGIKF